MRLSVDWVLGRDGEDGDALGGRTLRIVETGREALEALVVYTPVAMLEEGGVGAVVVHDEEGRVVDAWALAAQEAAA